MRSEKTGRSKAILEAIYALPRQDAVLMEVCGTHTMAIAKAGIKSLLPEGVRLVSGPGCPVCVTPAEVIDAALALSMDKKILIATYGDMIRVPGSAPGDSLQRRRGLGAEIKIVYSPVDAVELARERPDREVVFLGVGFETTAPGTAAAVLMAKEAGVNNFSLWSMLKTVEPALRALIGTEGFHVQGFLCPGHVASIIGERGFAFLPRDFGIPAVISGFEGEDILLAVYLLLRQMTQARPRLENEYRRAVSKEGNTLAMNMLARCFRPRADIWRGLGKIEESGLALREEFSDFDAERKFAVKIPLPTKTACRCGEVICGRLRPGDCPLFGGRCTPEEPVGPCMVSSEGACAAAYQYQAVD